MKPTIEKLLESHDDELPTFAFPSGYPILYVNAYNDTLCPECANIMLRKEEGDWEGWVDWEPKDWFIYHEGGPLECCECGKHTKSAYGDPEREQE